MTRRGRTTKWVGVAVCIGLAATCAAAWRARIGPVRWHAADGRTWIAGCGRATLVVGVAPPLHFSTLHWFAPLADGAPPAGSGPVWWPRWSTGPDGRAVWIPLWMPLAAAGALTAWAWRRDARVPPGHCRGCRYNLSGLAPGLACPECGQRV